MAKPMKDYSRGDRLKIDNTPCSAYRSRMQKAKRLAPIAELMTREDSHDGGWDNATGLGMDDAVWG